MHTVIPRKETKKTEKENKRTLHLTKYLGAGEVQSADTCKRPVHQEQQENLTLYTKKRAYSLHEMEKKKDGQWNNRITSNIKNTIEVSDQMINLR